MSLHDAIGELNRVFFDAESGFAELVTYVPQGVEDDQFEIEAIVDWGDEEGNNQVRGEGRASLNQERGRSVRSTPVVELPTWRNVGDATVAVVVHENGKDRIIVAKHGQNTNVRLAVKRIIARDEAAQTVLCSLETEYAAQPRRTRFG